MATKSGSKSSARRGSASKSGSGSSGRSAGRRAASKRELISPNGDKRYVRRGATGRFKESDDVGRSLSADRRRSAKTKAKRGQGDRGDR
jgi:hypothetical protein